MLAMHAHSSPNTHMKTRVAGHASNPSAGDETEALLESTGRQFHQVSEQKTPGINFWFPRAHTYIFTCTHTYSPLAEMTLIPVISSLPLSVSQVHRCVEP